MLTISIDDKKNSKDWLSVLNERKNCGVKAIWILCADGLSGMKEAVGTIFPKTEY